MGKFDYPFSLLKASATQRLYACEEKRVRLDFVSASCLRVAVFEQGQELHPTFNTVDAAGEEQSERLGACCFEACAPKCEQTEAGENYFLPCGVEIRLHLKNFLLEYYLGEKRLFADRAPLAYNFGGEFGAEQYHYITREEGEMVLGLGDKGGSLNKAGRAFRMEAVDCMGYNAEKSDPLYKNIAFYICQNKVGTYGLFYDSAATSYIDLGKEINNYYPAYKYFKTREKALVYYVFFGTKLSVLQQFGKLCGKQAFAPKWSFHYCASTMAYTDAQDSERQFDSFLEKLEQTELPCRGFYLSSGYTSIGNQRCVFHWNREKFPKPEAFIRRFESRGIHLIANIKPAMLTTHPMYREFAQKGYFVKNKDGSVFVSAFWDGLGSYLDFTNPETYARWKALVTSTLLDMGMLATWNDNNEFDIQDIEAKAAGFGKGSVAAADIRPTLTYLMVRASYEAQLEKRGNLRPFLSTRSGGIAVRRLAQTWSGDNRSAFSDLRYCHNIGLTLSLSGLGFYGHDLGGFTGAMPSRELLLRWLQHGVFEPRFTIHSWNEDGSATMPWSYPDILPAVQALFKERERLLPYFYSSAYFAVEEELPLNAPPLLYYDDEALCEQTDAMLAGRDLLVAFVFDEGEVQTNVYLPGGEQWYLRDKCYEGGQSVLLEIQPSDTVPFFVRAGSVIATDEGDGTVFTVYPKAEGSFESRFFDDDGESFRYREGDCVKLHFQVTCTETQIRVNYSNQGKMPCTPAFRLWEGDSRELIIEKREDN